MERQVGDVTEARLVTPVVEERAIAIGGTLERPLVRAPGATPQPRPQHEQRRPRDDAHRVELQTADSVGDVRNGLTAGRRLGQALRVKREPARLRKRDCL